MLAGFQLRELWNYRELLRFLVVRDIKVRYKQTVLGGFFFFPFPVLMLSVAVVALGVVMILAALNVAYLFVTLSLSKGDNTDDVYDRPSPLSWIIDPRCNPRGGAV